MKISIIAPYRTVAPHFETELELAQQHRDRGDTVEYVACTGELPCCDFNPDHGEAACHECAGRRLSGLELVEPAVRTRNFNQFGRSRSIDLQTEFESVEQLMSYRAEGFDIGYAVLSSLVSLVRDPCPDLQAHSRLIRNLITAAWRVYASTLQYIDRVLPDRVYVFNGRFASMRAVFRACQQRGVECFLHERGCDINHYELYENSLPHDISYIVHQIESCWNRADDEERQRLGTGWFEDRVNRIERNWKSFVKDQSRGMLPAGFSSRRHNVALFTSSDDEFVAIGDSWQHKLYADQLAGVVKITADFSRQAGEQHIYLRLHPNLAGVNNRQKDMLLSIDTPNVTVIPPDAAVDSYALLNAVDNVASFGSSMGIEAVYWGKPSILLGPCFYRNLGGTYQPANHDDVMRMMTSRLDPLSAEGAVKYGFWFQTHGYPFQYFQATSLFEGRFKEELVYARKSKSVAARLKRTVTKMKNACQKVSRRVRSKSGRTRRPQQTLH